MFANATPHRSAGTAPHTDPVQPREVLEHQHVADCQRDDIEGDDAGMSRSVRRIDNRSHDRPDANRERAGDHQASA